MLRASPVAPPGAIEGASGVEYVDLSNMGLHSLAQVDIERLSGAVILDLSGNELTEIDSL